MVKVAVVGAGFAGLSVCWHLLEQGNCSVTLFDPLGIGGGASGVSTGLLYPFTGRLALRTWLGTEGMEAANELLEVAERALQRTVAARTGVYRIVALPVQRKAYYERSLEDAEAIWIPDMRSQIPLAIEAPGLWIPSGITVFSKLYLEGLWLACSQKGAQLEKTNIETLTQLEGYDAIVLCTGSSTLGFAECASLSLHNTGRSKAAMETSMEPVKGQTLLCHWNEDFPFSLVGLGHITPTEHRGLCTVGSTYEHRFLDLKPTELARRELIEKVGSFYPPAHQFEVVSQSVGVRMCPRYGYRPFMEPLNSRLWVFVGLGSRGLLYHGVLGKRLALSVLRK
jgi:glycine/D-amino acid oxidase-like deaminating enzyme